MNVTFRDSSTLVIDANIAVWAVLPILASSGMDALGRIEGWKKDCGLSRLRSGYRNVPQRFGTMFTLR
jgi:hypothetical protein